MFETGLLVAAIAWFMSGIWLVVSLFRIILPRWRRSGIMQAKLEAIVFVLTFVGVIACNQLIYLDYGLTSREGLDEARTTRKEARQAEEAAAKAKAARASEAAAKAKAEQDARQAAIDAETRKSEALAQAAEAKAEKAAALAKNCANTTMAFVMSQGFVKRNLKAPSTAEFPWYTDDQVAVSIKPNCGFRVVAWVDAQNGFGAQIRSR